MAIPDWAVDQLKRQLNDVASQLKNPEAVQHLRERATEFLHELPQTASRVWDQAREGVQANRSQRKYSGGFQTGQQGTADAGVLNATGIYSGVHGATALSPAVVQAAVDALNTIRTRKPGAQSCFALEIANLAKAIGCEHLLISNRVESALFVLADVARRRGCTVFVPRCCAVTLDGGVSLPDLLVSGGANVREIGSRDGLNTDQWKHAGATSEDILVVAGAPKHLDVPPADVECLLVSVVDCGTIKPLGSSVTPQPPTFGELLNGACDVVLTSGAGLLGGQNCGLILGDRQALNEMQSSPLWLVGEAPEETQAMLILTIDSPTPLDGLLETSIENLRHRADNLATRLAAAGEDDGGAIKQCLLTDYPARLTAGTCYEVASRQLRLRHTTLTASEWASQLSKLSPAVLASVDDDALVVDLRWVDVTHDSTLAEALSQRG